MLSLGGLEAGKPVQGFIEIVVLILVDLDLQPVIVAEGGVGPQQVLRGPSCWFSDKDW